MRLNDYLKNPTQALDVPGAEQWAHKFLKLDSVLSNFVKSNLLLDFLWIFSQLRSYPENKDCIYVCEWLISELNEVEITHKSFKKIEDLIDDAAEDLVKKLKILPSIDTLLTQEERQKVRTKLPTLRVTDKCLNFFESEQYQSLLQLNSIPIVYTFLNHYESYLDLITSNSLTNDIDKVIEYILLVSDIRSDSIGVMGLVDDLYALTLIDSLSSKNKIDDLCWDFETRYPDFRYPINSDVNGNNLYSKADQVIKSSLITQKNRLPKIYEISSPEQFALLTAMLATIVSEDRGKNFRGKGRLRESFIVNHTYSILYKKKKIILKFRDISEYGSQRFYMFSCRSKQKSKLKRGDSETLIRSIKEGILREYQSDIIDHGLESNLELSFHDEIMEFENHPERPEFYPFTEFKDRNLKLNKVAIIGQKKSFLNLISNKVNDISIADWFGIRFFNLRGAHEIHEGRLSEEPLIDHYITDDSYYSINRNLTCDYQVINLFSNNRIDFKDITELSAAFDGINLNVFKSKISWAEKNALKENHLEKLNFKVREDISYSEIFNDNYPNDFLSLEFNYPNIININYDNALYNKILRLLDFDFIRDNVTHEISQFIYRLRNQLTLIPFGPMLDDDQIQEFDYFCSSYFDKYHEFIFDSERKDEFTSRNEDKLELQNNLFKEFSFSDDDELEYKFLFNLYYRLKTSEINFGKVEHLGEEIVQLIDICANKRLEIAKFNKLDFLLSKFQNFNPEDTRILISRKNAKERKKPNIPYELVKAEQILNLRHKNLLIPSFTKESELRAFEKSPYIENLFLLKSTYELQKYGFLNADLSIPTDNSLNEKTSPESIENFIAQNKSQFKMPENINSYFQLNNALEMNKNKNYESLSESITYKFLDDSTYSVPKGGRLICIDHTESEIVREIKASNIFENQYIVIPRTIKSDDGKDFVDFMLSLNDPNYENLLELALSWRNDLRKYQNEKNLSLERLTKVLENYKIKRASSTVNSWLKFDASTIAPEQHRETLSRMYGDMFNSKEKGQLVVNSVERIYEKRKDFSRDFIEMLNKQISADPEFFDGEEEDIPFEISMKNYEYECVLRKVYDIEESVTQRNLLYRIIH